MTTPKTKGASDALLSLAYPAVCGADYRVHLSDLEEAMKIVFEEAIESRPDAFISEVGNGTYVVTQDADSDWINVAVVKCGNLLIRITPLHVISNNPEAFSMEAAIESGMRVRPIQPGDVLRCVE